MKGVLCTAAFLCLVIIAGLASETEGRKSKNEKHKIDIPGLATKAMQAFNELKDKVGNAMGFITEIIKASQEPDFCASPKLPEHWASIPPCDGALKPVCEQLHEFICMNIALAKELEEGNISNGGHVEEPKPALAA